MKPLLTDENGSNVQLVVTPELLKISNNPAVARMAILVERRDYADPTVSYTRMHHRHARSHTRK